MNAHPLHRRLTLLTFIIPIVEFIAFLIPMQWSGWMEISEELVTAMAVLGICIGFLALLLSWRTSLRRIAMVGAAVNLFAGPFLLVPAASWTHCETTYCPSHMKMLATSIITYSQDHSGRLPSPGNWNAAALKFSRSPDILFCPDVEEKVPGYALNKALVGVRLTDLANRPEIIMFFECAPGRNRVGGSGIAEYRHKGGCYASYADGHVKWLTKSEFLEQMQRNPR